MKKIRLLLDIIKYAYILFLKRRFSIIIAAPYFTEDELKDGYFKRIKAIDNLFSNTYKIYIDFVDVANKPSFEEPRQNTLVINYVSSFLTHKAVILLYLLIVGRLYCHSVYQVKKRFFNIPFLKIYVDLHGAVPEEMFLYNNYQNVEKYNNLEKIVVNKSEGIICVSKNMKKHLIYKYKDDFKVKNIVILPIYDDTLYKNNLGITKSSEKRIITYAGGLMKWQNIEMMQQGIYKQINSANYIICVPDPDTFWAKWKYERNSESLTVETKSFEDLCREVYSISHYGFILRDDIVVNRVACPTKLGEYLLYDIIPILKSPNIGDFNDLGLKYLPYDSFINGNFFNELEREKVIQNNRKVLYKYINIYNYGSDRFRKLFNIK
jgi:hypothetical protein